MSAMDALQSTYIAISLILSIFFFLWVYYNMYLLMEKDGKKYFLRCLQLASMLSPVLAHFVYML